MVSTYERWHEKRNYTYSHFGIHSSAGLAFLDIHFLLIKSENYYYYYEQSYIVTKEKEPHP